MTYRSEKSFPARKQECEKLLEKFADRVPIIIEQRASFPGKLDKNKYLVPKEINVGQMLHLVRRRSKCAPETGIFLFINNTMPPSTALIHDLSHKHKDDDGFLYMDVCGEDTYGFGSISK
jgi:GABA(A) receptor-associated protein